VARKLEPAGKHDACFLPRSAHVTGDILVHEMAWARAPQAPAGEGPEEELVIVNTRFSCLARRALCYSFVPIWRPPFVSSLAPDDRCHLNGLAVRDATVRYVSALGATDSAAGWREKKRDGGVVLEVPSGEIIARGLSMPHSPRWHGGKLWLLESGTGTIGFVDEATGRYEAVAGLPGFTRGLSFCGRFAFVGLSQVRETAVFSGIPIVERQERCCGVWVVDVVTGNIAAYLKFEDAVQEVFAVHALPGRRFPEVINDDPVRLAESFVLPDEALAEVDASLREPACAPGAFAAS
jgi:uncharacterized protein (TIGR03032 family)